ncbi:catalase family protein [Teichococcus aestuarii]|uniref:hypothetical protein n=1 Tax=Teichococcus aestuarii TaxID=568898 RepID=UPI003621155F
MANAPAFLAPDPKAFAGSLKLLARTTDTPQGLKKMVSTVLRGAEAVVETFGGESAMLKSMGGHPSTHILGETFWSRCRCATATMWPSIPSLRFPRRCWR